MKFYVSVALAAILMTGTAGAQHRGQKVTFGIKGGLNLYNIHNNMGLAYDTRIGFHTGVIGHIHLVRQLALQPEIVYSVQGAKYKIDGAETTRQLGYINVPVLAQYMFDNGFRLQAGPQLGFLVNARSETNNASTDIKDNLNAVDLALSAGVGYVHPPTGFGVDARFNLGLGDMNENGNIRSTNRVFQVGVFYLFRRK